MYEKKKTIKQRQTGIKTNEKWKGKKSVYNKRKIKREKSVYKKKGRKKAKNTCKINENEGKKKEKIHIKWVNNTTTEKKYKIKPINYAATITLLFATAFLLPKKIKKNQKKTKNDN